jgi:two-component system KDP operon response regulator KdpE
VSDHKPRILVIDDEPQIHRFLGPALDAAGYEPVHADTAGAGLKELARRPPDAVVLDLGLPDLDGKEALLRARAFYEGPILILSARDRETEKIDALDAGADDYLEKPFGVGELLARLRVALRHRLREEGAEPVVTAGDLTIDLIKRLVTRHGGQGRDAPPTADRRLGPGPRNRRAVPARLRRPASPEDRARPRPARLDPHRAGCRLPLDGLTQQASLFGRELLALASQNLRPSFTAAPDRKRPGPAVGDWGEASVARLNAQAGAHTA